jgi:hypothetical protein
MLNPSLTTWGIPLPIGRQLFILLRECLKEKRKEERRRRKRERQASKGSKKLTNPMS